MAITPEIIVAIMPAITKGVNIPHFSLRKRIYTIIIIMALAIEPAEKKFNKS